MSRDLLVSILIPAFNADEWIGDTIRSALAQTWSQKEIIVVDDGSSDQTVTVARQFEREGVRVVTQPNQGAAAARNRALDIARGDFIQWLDADDLLAPDKIAHQMAVAEETKDRRVLLSSPWAFFRFRPSQAKFKPCALCSDLDPTEWLTRKWEGNLHMQTATWLVSQELSEAAGPWDTRLLGDDDGEYFSRVINASRAIRFVPASKVYYRITPMSRLSYIGHSDEKMEAQFLGMKLQIGYLRAREDGARVRAACVSYLQTWLPAFYPNRPDLVEEARQLARTLGGTLRLPKASWKYAWIEKLFGFGAAKRVQLSYNRVKACALRSWDKMMWSLEGKHGLPS